MEEHCIRTAVIGMGNMGSQYAALLVSGAVPGMCLAAVTRVRPETLAARHLTLPEGLPVFQTAEQLFEAVDTGALALDAVIIATPHRLHQEQAEAAMKRGLCVLSDKPAGICSSQARRMEQARPEGLVCGYIFQQRTFPAYRNIRELVRSGRLGKLKRVSWTVTDWYRSNAYYAGSGWRGSWEKDGGGTLLNQCPAVTESLVREENGKIGALVYCGEGGPDKEAQVQAHVTETNRTLPLYKRISAVHFSAEPLPRNAAGKLLR